jgi:hypothetical protein
MGNYVGVVQKEDYYKGVTLSVIISIRQDSIVVTKYYLT